MHKTNKTQKTFCPLCGGESTFAFEVREFDLFDCVSCDHRFIEIENAQAHLSSIYDDKYFTGGGAGYANYLTEEKLLRGRGRMYAQKIVPFFEKPGRMLGIGVAAGCILKGFEDGGWSCIGLEPNKTMAEAGREHFGLDMRQVSLEEFETSEEFEFVSAIQVAGHFYDPRKAFENIFGLLRPGGCLLIETWNRDSLSAKIFGKNWHEYSPPSVVHWWTSDGLTRFLKSIGFEKVTGGRPYKNISGEHARSLLEYRIGKTRLQKLIPKSLNIPYPSEDLFWGLYRKE